MRMPTGWKIAATLMLGVIGVALLADVLAYKFDGFTSCRSDHLYVLRNALDAYSAEHAGSFPPSLDAIQAKVGQYSRCAGSDQLFVLLPKEVVIPDGFILVMCPLGSHGLLRRFGFGLVKGNKAYEIARIGANGKVIERHPIM